ncbi:MAG: intradiol ring-cleavage dioxygenase [Bacteroidota bacterium]
MTTKWGFLMLLVLLTYACSGQQADQKVGGPCEGCEALYEYGDKNLSHTDTFPRFDESANKILVKGRVLALDGKTPVEDVIIYAYHTDEHGIYPKKGDPDDWSARHGYLRGWVKTNKNGEYQIYTFRPASYPNTTIPQHIHVTIKEEGKTPYFIDDILFDDDPNLSDYERSKQRKRGGSGIVTPVVQNGILIIERDIILGMNIQGY